MTIDELITLALKGAGVENDNLDNVTLGSFTASTAPASINAIMEKVTTDIDALLSLIPVDSLDAIELRLLRGFTYKEFQALFNSGIRPEDYGSYPVFQALHISNHFERRRWLIYSINDEYEAYLRVLMRCLAPLHENHLVTFFFPVRFVGAYKNRWPYPYHCEDWRR